MGKLPNLPGWAEWLLELVGGGSYPHGDPDKMRALAAIWHTAATDLKPVLDEIPDAEQAVRRAYPHGDGGQAMVDRLAALRQGDGSDQDQSLTKLIEYVDETVGEIKDVANEIEYAQLMIVTSLGLLAIEIAAALLLPPIADEAAEMGAIMATRVAVRRIAVQLLKRVAERIAESQGVKRFVFQAMKYGLEHLVLSTTLGAGQDLGIQAYQRWENHTDRINWGQTGMAALGGAVAGAVSPFGLRAGTSLAERAGLGPRLTGIAEHGLAGLAGAAGGAAASTAAGFTNDLVQGKSLNQALHDAESGLDWRMFSAGAVGGAASATSRGIRGHAAPTIGTDGSTGAPSRGSTSHDGIAAGRDAAEPTGASATENNAAAGTDHAGATAENRAHGSDSDAHRGGVPEDERGPSNDNRAEHGDGSTAGAQSRQESSTGRADAETTNRAGAPGSNGNHATPVSDANATGEHGGSLGRGHQPRLGRFTDTLTGTGIGGASDTWRPAEAAASPAATTATAPANHPAATAPVDTRGPAGLESARPDAPLPAGDGSTPKPTGVEQIRQSAASTPAPDTRGGAGPEKLPYAGHPGSGIQARRTGEAVAVHANSRDERPIGDGSAPVPVAAPVPAAPHTESRSTTTERAPRFGRRRPADPGPRPSPRPPRGEGPENVPNRRRPNPAGPADPPDDVGHTTPPTEPAAPEHVMPPEPSSPERPALPYETQRTFDDNGDRVTKATVRAHLPEGIGGTQRAHAELTFRQAVAAMTGSDPRLLYGDRLALDIRFVDDPAQADFHVPADSITPDAAIRHLRDHLGLPDSGVLELTAHELRTITDQITVDNTAAALRGLPETREFGHGKLAPLEDPAYQEQLRDACREDDQFVIGADPRTHPMGGLINDGGMEVAGRDNDCVETCLAGLSTFHGDPQVALPLHLDDLIENTDVLNTGEEAGMDRVESWLGGEWSIFPQDLSIADQFQALHDYVDSLGPGASAIVLNEWHAFDLDTGEPLYNSDGTPKPDVTSHTSLVVYPLDADGPVWWDPQSSVTSDHPPTPLVDGSATIQTIVLLPDGSPDSAVTDPHHPGSTAVPGSGPPRAPGISAEQIRVRLDMHPDSDPAGGAPSGDGEIGAGRPDRSDHGSSELVGADDRRPAREGGSRGGPYARTPDLSADNSDRSTADQRRTHPGDLPGEDRIPGAPGPADRGLPPDHRQTGQITESPDLGDQRGRSPAEEPVRPRRDLAGTGDIRILNDANRSGHGPAEVHEPASHPDHDATPESQDPDSTSERQTGGSTRPRNPFDEPAQHAWADDAYDIIRASDTDVRDAVANLSGLVRGDGSVGFTTTEIGAIKQHLFVDEHKLSIFDDNGDVIGYEQRRFDADADIAEAWMRLTRGEPLAADVTLLEHELAEADYLRRHPDASYREAHEYANSKAHWENEIPGRTGENHEKWGETDRAVPGLPEGRRNPGRGDVPLREQRDGPGSATDHPEGRRGRDSGGRSIGPAADEGGSPNPEQAHGRPRLAGWGRDSGLTDRLPVEDKPYYGNPEYRDPVAEREYARTAKLDEAIRIRAENAADHPEIARLSNADIAVIRRNQDMNLNQAVNGATRDGDGALLDKHDIEIRALINAYNKLPDHQGRVLRSLYIDDPVKLSNFLDEYRQGNTVPDRGFASADKESSMVGGNIELIIDSHSGKDISWASTWQDEVVFPPGTEFRVRSVVPRDGKVYIHLEDLGRNADAHHSGGMGRDHAEGGGTQRHPAPAVPREPGGGRPQYGVHRGAGSSRPAARDEGTGRDLAGVGRVGAPEDRPGAGRHGRVDPAPRHPAPEHAAGQHRPAHAYSRQEVEQARHGRQAREQFRQAPPEHGRMTQVPAHGPGSRPAFEVRRHLDASGGPISVVTVRAHATVDARIPVHEMNRLWENAQFACDTAFNHGRSLPSGDRLLVDLVHTPDPAAAHLHIHADPRPGAPWHPGNHPRVLADHLRAQLGLAPDSHGHGLAPHELRHLGAHIDAATHPVPHRPSVHEAGATHGERTAAGISHHDDPGLRNHARLVPHDSYHYTADVHLTPDGHAVIGGHEYTAADYADLLRNEPAWNHRDPIRLIGCDGATNGFAADLARHLGVDVTAPTHSAWTDNHGRVYTSTPEADAYGNRRPRIPPDGHWETFHPDGTSIRTSTDGFAPFTPDAHKYGLDTDTARERAIEGGYRPEPDGPPHPGSVDDPHAIHEDAREAGPGTSDEPAHGPDDEPPTRRFETDAEGSHYGETVLGPVRDGLPPHEFGEAQQYTNTSVVNAFLRHGDVADLVRTLERDHGHFRDLSNLFGSDQVPTPDVLMRHWQRTDLTPGHRDLLAEILDSENPLRHITSIWKNASKYRKISLDFRAPPSVDLIENHATTLDAAGRPLPEHIEGVRGLSTIEFLTVDGIPLGPHGSPLDLIGTIQTEAGFMSASLGAKPPPDFDGEYRMELEIPSGTRGVWMGLRSSYPDQRELILPRGVRYEIIAAIPDPPGERYSEVKWLLRARISIQRPAPPP
ncbi:toxin glutamine deamidase domain-containing protein [Nocardia sp. alder85J]|uniref:WXG100-like domain-containing protein n=1 Tax=Nocardia sp. alder85J TaxID=2862949 RepID=UPI001CD219F2|nr:toxin glutamine deamidase domain-containing protein [Nocardia sp. alder85J]MCX4093051.1 toxin glutamine deamidase domain-containing protein [Nocardia sp. alder85J]